MSQPSSQFLKFHNWLLTHLPQPSENTIRLLLLGEADPALKKLLAEQACVLDTQVLDDFIKDPVTSPTYDVLLLLNCLINFADISPVFEQAKACLKSDGRLLLVEIVADINHPEPHFSQQTTAEIEHYFAASGFFCRHHLSYPLTVKKQMHCGEYQECWDLRPDIFKVRNYRPGDEYPILDAFQEIFSTQRSKAHWLWKFAQNPFGPPMASLVWKGHHLLAQYAAYPVPFWMQGDSFLTQQVGDIFIDPQYRGIGRGQTSLLGRAFRHYTRVYCEGQIPFFYSFLTGTHLRFGKLFLNYQCVTYVQEWHLPAATIPRLKQAEDRWNWLHGYKITETETVEAWADEVFVQARNAYGSLIARNQQYLTWRYQNHPDQQYHFFVISLHGKALGWWICRVENQILFLGDALFVPGEQALFAARLGLIKAFTRMQKKYGAIQLVVGWFGNNPQWWVEILKNLKFTAQPQSQGLELCVSPFSQEPELKVLQENHYYTQGDSDLF
ncbi:GNAT family protein [Candidatus Venteria ishoeyi]|uniref:Uncharacterized protein n=1 Tax=Candidatus Venteria ishoeyi TaxID=1899563 RepID=A0A1H6FB03_9GAMM|nr:GNAT family N-acetyltransferase [Candidatus Venteria ishoeyi]SEH06185.1 Uncharacterised protein [Candidatus Venteria ishoeyi]